MKRFVAGADRGQSTLLPECLDDWVDESNPVRVIDAFVDALDLDELGFSGVEPAVTGRPSYHPCVLLKLYIYGYLNRVGIVTFAKYRRFSSQFGSAMRALRR
jgi:transposase